MRVSHSPGFNPAFHRMGWTAFGSRIGSQTDSSGRGIPKLQRTARASPAILKKFQLFGSRSVPITSSSHWPWFSGVNREDEFSLQNAGLSCCFRKKEFQSQLYLDIQNPHFWRYFRYTTWGSKWQLLRCLDVIRVSVVRPVSIWTILLWSTSAIRWVVWRWRNWNVPNGHERRTCLVSNWGFPKIGVPQNGWFIMGKPY